MTQETFNLIDYGVFGISLLLSLLVGIYYIFKSRRLPLQNQKEEFLMGSRKMPIIPVTLSILTTFLSGLTLLGTPAEVYTKGFFLWVYYMMCPLVLLFTSFAILPVFYKLKYISIYEYLETRFHSRLLRQLGATLFLVNSTFYLSVVIYAPAVALSGVTNISTWPFILVIGVVCTLYTSLGGLKAVVWTDTLQAAFMYAGIFSLTIMGIQSSGGLSQVFYTAYNNERFKSLSNVNPSPFQYDSLWIGMFGGSVFWMSLYGPNQMAMQRYCSMSTLEQGRKVMWLTIPAFIIMGSFCCFLGIVMFSFFDKLGCDPLASKKAHTQDQLVLLMVLNTLGQVPGLSGLFLACLFSGTLSTVSSGINSMAAVVWEDMIKLSFGSRLTDTESTLVTKSLTCAFGFLTVCLSFVAGEIGSIVQAATTLLGSLSGPLIAMFFLGIFTKRATGKSTLIGVLLAMLVNGTIAIGGIVHKPYSAYSLNSANMTQCQSNITYIEKMDQFGNKIVFIGFRLSPYLLTLNGFVLTLITGYTLSWILPEKPQTNIIDREMVFID